MGRAAGACRGRASGGPAKLKRLPNAGSWPKPSPVSSLSPTGRT